MAVEKILPVSIQGNCCQSPLIQLVYNRELFLKTILKDHKFYSVIYIPRQGAMPRLIKKFAETINIKSPPLGKHMDVSKNLSKAIFPSVRLL